MDFLQQIVPCRYIHPAVQKTHNCKRSNITVSNKDKIPCIFLVILSQRYQTAQELVSHDIHNNTYNYKDTFSVELVPICKDNIVCLQPRLAQKLGNMGQICIVSRVTQSLHIIDPSTCQSECVIHVSVDDLLVAICKSVIAMLQFKKKIEKSITLY